MDAFDLRPNCSAHSDYSVPRRHRTTTSPSAPCTGRWKRPTARLPIPRVFDRRLDRLAEVKPDQDAREPALLRGQGEAAMA